MAVGAVIGCCGPAMDRHEGAQMARLTNREDLAPSLDAFQKWIDGCLVKNGSVFSTSALWTPELVEEVRGAFVDHPDLGKDDFSTKLKRQMKNASPPAQQLMAEMLWALLLFPSNVNADTKRQYVRDLWALSGQNLGESLPLLADDVLAGIGSGGPGFNNHRWREMVFLLALTGDLKDKREDERRRILSDYDAFMDWIGKVPQEGSRQFRHMLRFSAFPDRVERMSSNGDRRRVLEAFGVGRERDTKSWGDRELDEALFQLRGRLEAESPSTVLDFYEQPLRARWKAKDTEESDDDEPGDGQPRNWIEKTHTIDRPDRLSGSYALGEALWSPQRDQRGADIYRFMRDVHAGDVVLHLTDNEGFTGVSIVASPHEEFGGVPESEWGGSGKHYLIRLRAFRKLDPPLSREVFFSSPTKERLVALLDEGHRNLFYNREPSLNQGAYLTPAPSELLAILDEAYQRIGGRSILGAAPASPVPQPASSRPVVKDLKETSDRFAAALLASHVSFGERHEEIARSFLASLATKPFVILTGLSGSGKTQLALRFGDWLGVDRSEAIPVRPDWTGAEALFGYENTLLPRSPDGRAAWEVPKALRFMLRAATDGTNAYLLILDEMNLAHVERYFADFLSGMESDQPCLPNLRKERDGFWRSQAGEPAEIPVPRNLFVVGTVNVDETTYMFSPKVLDRANTFEFRVPTTALTPEARRPRRSEVGDEALVGGFLAIARDDEWQLRKPAPGLEVFTGHLRGLHALLSDSGFEFGHRVFYEAIRFASMLASAGDTDPMVALDRQVMQKVMPRLHGSRRRLEGTLRALGRFCFDLGRERVEDGDATAFDPLKPPEGDARLGRSFDKVRRMTRALRANQFASFTE